MLLVDRTNDINGKVIMNALTVYSLIRNVVRVADYIADDLRTKDEELSSAIAEHKEILSNHLDIMDNIEKISGTLDVDTGEQGRDFAKEVLTYHMFHLVAAMANDVPEPTHETHPGVREALERVDLIIKAF